VFVSSKFCPGGFGKPLVRISLLVVKLEIRYLGKRGIKKGVCADLMGLAFNVSDSNEGKCDMKNTLPTY
jgi:hypothetical protein